MKRTHLALVMLGLIAVVSAAAAAHRGCESSASKSTALTEIKIDNFSFAPVKITVPAGTTVKWTNRDDIPHTVVSEDKKTFKSEVLDTNQEFTHKIGRASCRERVCLYV